MGIIPHATVRAEDNIALSSRNIYLSPEERVAAQQIPLVLKRAKEEATINPKQTAGDLLNKIRPLITESSLKLQYLEITQKRELLPVELSSPLNQLTLPHLFVAVYAGMTRLIDNISLASEQ